MVCIRRARAPVKGKILPFVQDLQLAALVLDGEADNQGAKLVRRAWGVDVTLELARRSRVHLSFQSATRSNRDKTGWTAQGIVNSYIELVQFGANSPVSARVDGAGKE
jgi:hypothetical protein